MAVQPFIPVPKAAKVQLVFSQQGQICENVFNVGAATDFDVPMLQTAIDNFAGWLNASWPITASQEVTALKVVATALHAVGAPGIETAMNSNVKGSDIAQAYPMNVSVAISWHTGIRGRSFNGRSFHVGLTAAMAVDSTLTDLMHTTLMTAYTNLLTRSLGGNQHLVVVSRRTAKAWRTTGLATQITSLSIDKTIDSQRRRLPGRGR